MMIRRSAIFVALLASTAALAVPALASGASTEAKVTVGSPPTPYLPNGQGREVKGWVGLSRCRC
jgi:hypothetical protein